MKGQADIAAVKRAVGEAEAGTPATG